MATMVNSEYGCEAERYHELECIAILRVWVKVGLADYAGISLGRQW